MGLLIFSGYGIHSKAVGTQTNGFALFPTVPFSRTAVVGLSNRQWTMSFTTDARSDAERICRSRPRLK